MKLVGCKRIKLKPEKLTEITDIGRNAFVKPVSVSVSITKLVLVHCYKWIGKFACWLRSIFNLLIYGVNYAVVLTTNAMFTFLCSLCCICVM